MSTELEAKVAFLEKALFSESMEALARDCMVRALIVTHPKLPALRLAFEMLIETQQARMSEHAFSTGRDASVSRGLHEDLKKYVGRWLAFFPPA